MSFATFGAQSFVNSQEARGRAGTAIRRSFQCDEIGPPPYLNPMLEAVELPAGVADLDTGLPDVDGDTLTHLGDASGTCTISDSP